MAAKSAQDGEPPPCRLSAMGSGGCLLDAAGPVYDPAVQRRIWDTARTMLATAGVVETVPGMNNLMVVFDPVEVAPAALHEALLAVWRSARPRAVVGRTFDIPVVYGGTGGEDLPELAERTGLAVDAVVLRHAAATYAVAAVGAMPGFPYLAGLDPALAWERRASPRATVARGAVMIGGTQAGIMPVTAPSGWHIIGHTDTALFDPTADDPVLLRPGDSIRFTVAAIRT